MKSINPKYWAKVTGSFIGGNKGLPNICGSAGPGNFLLPFIFQDQITGLARKYKGLNLQVFIQDTGSNACFIEAKGQNDYHNVRNTSIFTIIT